MKHNNYPQWGQRALRQILLGMWGSIPGAEMITMDSMDPTSDPGIRSSLYRLEKMDGHFTTFQPLQLLWLQTF